MAKKFKVNPRAKRVIEETRARIASKVDTLLRDINVHVPRYTLQVVDGKDDTRKRGGVMVDQVFRITCLADVGNPRSFFARRSKICIARRGTRAACTVDSKTQFSSR